MHISTTLRPQNDTNNHAKATLFLVEIAKSPAKLPPHHEIKKQAAQPKPSRHSVLIRAIREDPRSTLYAVA
jgi:hypothetical protein